MFETERLKLKPVLLYLDMISNGSAMIYTIKSGQFRNDPMDSGHQKKIINIDLIKN